MKHSLEYSLVRLLIAVVRIVPDWMVRAMGTWLGLAFYTLDRAHRNIARRNIATAFPTRRADEQAAIARGASRRPRGRPRPSAEA